MDILDFTHDIEKAKMKIKASPAKGGGDLPEDVIGALREALKLNHKNGSLLLTYLICDYPSHGR